MTPDFRRTPPEPLAPVSFDISRPVETRLSNGLRVVIVENERLPLISFRLAFLTGDIHDPAEIEGSTSAMAAMLTEGTANYSSLQLAEKVERLGASLSANASDDFTVIAASSLSLYSSEVLGLLAEVLLRPVFPESELDLYRRNTVEHLRFQRSQPPFLAGEQIGRLIYGEHPYSKAAPAPEDIERLDREILTKVHSKSLVPNNAILLIVGDVDTNETIAELEDHFAEWSAIDIAETVFPSAPNRSARSLTIVDRPGSAQSNIVLGNLAVNRTDPDYFSLIVMNQVLGAGASSRIFMNLREEKGYTYGAYSRLNMKHLAGDFEATAEVRNEVTGASLEEFFLEFERIRTEPVSDEELTDAKSFLTGVFPIRAETQEGLINLIVNQHLYALPEDYLQTYREHVNDVTAGQVLEMAQKHIRPDEMAMVIVGDADEVVKQAESYASTLEIYNADGHLKEPAR